MSRDSGMVASIESLDLINRRPSILGKVEDVHFALRENDSHTNRGVAKGVYSVHETFTGDFALGSANDINML